MCIITTIIIDSEIWTFLWKNFIHIQWIISSKYRLLTEFEGRTVNYGPQVMTHNNARGPKFTVRNEKTRLLKYLLYLKET